MELSTRYASSVAPVTAAIPETRSPERKPLPFELSTEDLPVVASEPEMIEPLSPPPASEPAPIEPSAEEILHRAAREANANGDAKRARSIYRELLGLNPRHVRARNNLACRRGRVG